MAKRNYFSKRGRGNAAPKEEDNNFHDLGFSNFVGKNRKRFVNKDGSFNVIRSASFFKDFHIYQFLVSMSWASFACTTLLFYFVINCLFAGLYLIIGVEYLSGAEGDNLAPFWTAFFFSVQTLTTVGYGSVSPVGFGANLVAAMGALTGLMSFALGTGLLFARFSKPTASILFSENAIVAPFQDGEALMFRLANRRRNMLTNLQIEVTAAWLRRDDKGHVNRVYKPLTLERDVLSMLPLTWTIVHPITEKSPIADCMKHGFENADLEIIVVLEGYDDTFTSTIRTHTSYKYSELIWNAKFDSAFYFNEEGNTILEVDKLNSYTVLK
jgi:inward rectifier potassium channel